MTHLPKGRYQKFVVGFRPVVRAREGRMLGMRQPLDGPIFETLEDARNWCIHAMISHFDRRLGMSDAHITVQGNGGLWFSVIRLCKPPCLIHFS